MEVQLLGEVAVVGERGVCPIDAPLARRCLGALALSPGSLSLDRLADALWGDELPANWKPGLRNVVARLRLRLDSIGGGGAAVIATTPTGYRLAPACAVDVYRALGDADAADEALTAGEPDLAVELATAALARAGPVLLPDVDADWLTGYRTRLSWARTRSLQVAAAASREIGRAAQSVDLATQAVLADPLVEESHRQLIHAHAAAGDRAAALRAYEACRRTLANELGVAPDQETTDLHLCILGTEEAQPARPRAAGPFLGRDRELAMLRANVAGGAVVSIVGPGGIGKSRLAAAFAADEANGFDGATVVLDIEGQGRGSDLTTSLARRLGVATGTAVDVSAAMLDELAKRGRSLLVLDGVDHVADEVAGLVAAVAARCPTPRSSPPAGSHSGSTSRSWSVLRRSTPRATVAPASSATPRHPARHSPLTKPRAPRSPTCAGRSAASRSASNSRRGRSPRSRSPISPTGWQTRTSMTAADRPNSSTRSSRAHSHCSTRPNSRCSGGCR